MRVVSVVLVLLLAWSRLTAAEGIVLQSYTGKRPDDATRLLAPLLEELAARGYTSGDALGRKYEARVSRPAATPEGLPTDFETQVDRGFKAWVAGRFDDAVTSLEPLVEMAHANSALVSQNQALQEKLLKALVTLSLSQLRKGDTAAAQALFGEILRSFPNAQIPRGEYGPDANQAFEATRRELSKQGRGRLIVKVPTETAVVFIDERFENVGSVNKGDLLPGEYRVFLQVGKQSSRAHRALVAADLETPLAFDLGYDEVLRTSGLGVGFEFSDAVSREKNEARFAARFAGEIGATSVIVVGIDTVKGRSSLIGAVIDMRSGREIRRANIALDPTPGVDRVRALGEFLAGKPAAEGVDVEIGGDATPTEAAPETTADAEPAHGRSWKFYAALSSAGLGLAAGAFSVTYALAGKNDGDEITKVCAVSCSSAQYKQLKDQQDAHYTKAYVAGGVGIALLGTATVLYILSRHDHPHHSDVTLVPTPGGAFASYALTF